MYKTCKGLTYAKYSSGGDGAAIAYTGGKVKEKLTCKVDINFQYAEGQDYADGVRIAQAKKMTGVNTSFELAGLPDDVKEDILGWAVSSSEIAITDVEPGFVGIGFYIWDEDHSTNADNWIPYWIYKSKFTADTVSASTATDSIAYQHQTISGAGVGVKLTSSDTNWTFVASHEAQTTEAAAIAWLKAKAGIQT